MRVSGSLFGAVPPKFKLQEPVASEDDEHEALARVLTLAIAPAGQVSDQKVMWYSLELRNARSRVEGAKRKARGCVAGLPDVCIRWNHPPHTPLTQTYWIELKRRRRGRVSEPQNEMHERLRTLGDSVAVCHGWRAALLQIQNWRIPMKNIVLG